MNEEEKEDCEEDKRCSEWIDVKKNKTERKKATCRGKKERYTITNKREIMNGKRKREETKQGWKQ